MGTSQKTLDQVKSILGKLDRHIDDARQRRLGDPSPAVGPRTAPLPSPVAAGPATLGPNLNTTIPGPAVIGGPASPGLAGGNAGAMPPAPSKSLYGRAQPLRPEARSA